ncbi:helix-hairpin-helix domain-containing protein [Riemerella anatipestifer]|uniref:helix-hairpin-helix domain-containing protein n=1 Tax=Riemerella anatipestifer TaxID=34085 RepID=UPI001C6E10EC|nr:helix-hairpin-helix domain-containing protein [Riemerella anatipestifer]MCU7578160.1 helix-hairpin-helix domain-containing protein [Riemerella anatipestifer]QYQ99083.1 helix-hairpin-helix domain-containing protein [Riemerella anatipestifer]QZP00018.1 helix-hairpin-helix domain-containing protein [Riemerella anatipestifer]
MKKPFSRLEFSMIKKQVLGWSVIAVLLLGIQIFFYFYKKQKEEQPLPELTFTTSVEHQNREKLNLTPFNPNQLSLQDWQNLGFSERQSETILKYKDLLGGSFSSKEELSKCYVISAEKFSELSEFIMLPDKVAKSYESSSRQSFYKSKITVNKPFNPDLYSVSDWMKLGFSEKQAQSFIKYKNYLGGSFISKEKLRDYYTLSPENYAIIAPYVLLPNKVNLSTTNEIGEKKESAVYQPFDPNDLDLVGWQKLGFSEKQAAVIVNYKQKILKGRFKTADDVKKCFVISDEKFQALSPYIRIKNEEPSVVETTKPQIKTNFASVDLNEISYEQLVEFGFTPKAAKSYISFRGLLGGFANKKQILETYYIDPDLTQKLIETANLNTSKVKKYSLSNAPEEWLKKHPYFKYHADKIIFYRLTTPNDKKIIKFINPKPEYLEKMTWYMEE